MTGGTGIGYTGGGGQGYNPNLMPGANGRGRPP